MKVEVVKWFHRANKVLKYNQVFPETTTSAAEENAQQYTQQKAAVSMTLDPRKKIYLVLRCLDIVGAAAGSESSAAQTSYDIMIRVKTSSLA